MIQCRKAVPEMTALATRFTRCHLIQLHCWAKINSLMMTSALFHFLYLYIYPCCICSLVSFFFFAFLTVLMDLIPVFFPNVAAIRIPQICKKISLFHLCNYWHEGWVFETLTHAPLLVSLKPAEACSVNWFAKKPWHDLLSPDSLLHVKQFTWAWSETVTAFHN